MLTFLLLVAGALAAAAAARGVVITSRIVIETDPSAAAEEPSAARLAATGAVLLVAGVSCLLAASGPGGLVDLISRIGVLALAGAIVSAGASAWACRAGRCPLAEDEVGAERLRGRRLLTGGLPVVFRDRVRSRARASVVPPQARRRARPPAP